MTEVQVMRTADGSITELTVKGHASFGRHGEDIVCAAVSVLSQSAILGLEQVARHPVRWSRNDGYLTCKVEDGGTPESLAKAQAILETAVLGLRDIAKGYPKYVQILEGG